MTAVSEQRVSLGEAAYLRLRADIVTCRLAPGQRLTEKQLAVDTGFGMSPLRDALTRLDHEGLIRTLPRKGYQVAPLTPKLIDDLFVLWEIVGPEIVRLGLLAGSDTQLSRARARAEDLDRRATSAPGIDSALDEVLAAQETFTLLAEATGNSYLVNLHSRLFGELSRVWTMVLASDPTAVRADPPDDWFKAMLEERDVEKAVATSRRHIQKMRKRVLQAVVRWPSVMDSEVVAPLAR